MQELIADETPPCPTCGAMMDNEANWNFASKHVFMDILYYCNNPICPPDEEGH
jgi:hypothetical protein